MKQVKLNCKFGDFNEEEEMSLINMNLYIGSKRVTELMEELKGEL